VPPSTTSEHDRFEAFNSGTGQEPHISPNGHPSNTSETEHGQERETSVPGLKELFTADMTEDAGREPPAIDGTSSPHSPADNTSESQDQGDLRSQFYDRADETQPTISAAPSDFDLRRMGGIAAAHLQELLEFSEDRHKAANDALFKEAALAEASIDDPLWGKLAFIAGIYASAMARRPLNERQRVSMLHAAAWAVRYEVQIRPKFAKQRLQQTLSFIKAGFEYPFFRQESQSILSSIVDILDAKLLAAALDDIAQLGVLIPSELSNLSAEIPNSSDTLSSENDIAVKVSQLWRYLDRKHEAQNRRELSQLGNSLPTARIALAKLGGRILANMAYRYARRPSDVSAEDVDAALFLASDIVKSSSGEFRTRAAIATAIIRAVHDTRRGRLDRTSFIEQFKKVLDEDNNGWNDLAEAISLTLAQMSPGDSTKEIAIDWLRIFNNASESLTSTRKGEFVIEAKRHAPDSLLIGELAPPLIADSESSSPDRATAFGGIAELLNAYRRIDLAEIARILKANRSSLIAELSRKLANSNPPFDSIIPPRRVLRMPSGLGQRRGQDEFQEASRLLESSDEGDRRRACEIFEHLSEPRMGRRMHPDYRQLAREWTLYARARVRGLPSVFAEWDKDARSNAASWEAIWNLAVFHQRIGDLAAALNVLRPGLESLRAPYAHLRFAIYLAVQIIDPAASKKFDVAVAQSFLLKNIRLHPVPECYLVWLLLVDEAEIQILPQEKVAVLADFERLNEHPVLIPEATDGPSDTQIEALQRQLKELNLDQAWLIWINDYAERTHWRSAGYRRLAETLERSGKEVSGGVQRAGEAFQRALEIDARAYERKRAEGKDEPRYVRQSLTKLFSFYKKNFLEDARLKAYRRYSRDVPYNQFWDVLDTANEPLINLTRDLIEANSRPDAAPSSKSVGLPTTEGDSYIISTLKRVTSTRALEEIQDRVIAWIDAHSAGSAVAQKRASFIKSVVTDVVRLHKKAWSNDELKQEIKRLNTELERAAEHVSATKELRPLQDVVDAAQSAYRAFTELGALRPTLMVIAVPPGLPFDAPETSLALDIKNNGPGEVVNLQVFCSDGGVISTRSMTTVPGAIPEGTRTTVAVPVATHATPAIMEGHVACRAHVSYDSGVLKALKTEEVLTVPWYDFNAYLSQSRPGAYEIPIPYTEEPIDFKRNDPRLFQGREIFLEQVRSIVNGHLKTPPVYYHGIRKVGKSSLLSRIAVELRNAGVLPLLIKLEGIRAVQQSLPLIINTFTSKIIDAAKEADLGEELRSVPVNAPNPILQTIDFFRSLSVQHDGRRIALLIDEFPNLVAGVTTPLLDVLRQIYQEHRLLFFFSGWVRPKQLERECRDTQLFPLAYCAIDFLEEEAVAKVLQEPLADVRIQVPESTIKTAYELSAGNPHHLAALAIAALGRLNAERRVCMTPQDLWFAAERIVTDDRYFRSTIFSQMILSRDERDGAIRFAQIAKDRRAIAISEATKNLPAEVLEDLREKGIIQSFPGALLGVRGRLLAKYLQGRIVEEPPDSLESKSAPRVGIFADVENLRNSIPLGMSWEQVGRSLDAYAAQFGIVVCRWACYEPSNFADATGVRIGLERANFDVSFPETYLRRENRKDRADFVLIQRINDEQTHRVPQVFVIVAGDHAYAEVVNSLLMKDFMVVIVSNEKSLAADFEDLRQRDEQRRRISGLDGMKLKIHTNVKEIFA
jgi:hypothetical protein